MAIYYLDVDDEITAAATRIRDSADSRIALVVQGGSRVATSRINFRLLAREAQHRGRRLAIVAADASVRSMAQTAGLPVYASVAEYQKAETPGIGGQVAAPTSAPLGPVGPTFGESLGTQFPTGPTTGPAGRSGGPRPPTSRGSSVASAPTRRWPRLGRWLVLPAAGLIALGGAGGYLLWPSAHVVLTLRAELLGPLSLTIKVDPTVKSTDDATLTVPGIPRSFDVASRGTFTATGQEVVETAATGSVTFYNGNTGNAVTVPKGTQVETASRVAFATAAAVTVPKARFTGPTTVLPGSADVAVQAVKKGTLGNVAAGAIVNVPPGLAAQLALLDGQVTNKQATGGGTHTIKTFVQQSDVDAATTSLMGDLGASLASEVEQEASTATEIDLFPNTAQLGAVVWDPEPASLVSLEATSFDLNGTATGTAVAARTSTLESAIERKAKTSAKKGYALVDGSIETSYGTISPVGSGASISATVTGLQAPAIDRDQLKTGIKGKTAAEAEAYLSKYGQATVSIDPFWASTVTGFDFRLDIEIVAPTPAPTPTPRVSLQPRRTAAHPSESPEPSATPKPSSSASATPLGSATPSPSESLTPAPSASATPSATP